MSRTWRRLEPEGPISMVFVRIGATYFSDVGKVFQEYGGVHSLALLQSVDDNNKDLESFYYEIYWVA